MNTIQLKRGTYNRWISTATILGSGELGLDITNNIIKVGNGSGTWNDLPIFNTNISGIFSATTGIFQDIVANGSGNIILSANNDLGFPILSVNRTGVVNVNGVSNFSSVPLVSGIPVSVSGHTHIGDNILIELDDDNSTTLYKGSSSAQFLQQLNVDGLTEAINTVGGCQAEAINDFNSSVSGLIPVKSIAGSDYVTSSNSSGVFTIGVTGLQPSGNYSTIGHSHAVSDITNFGSGVSGLLPTISNSGNNRILTSTGSTVGINAESNLFFDSTNNALTINNNEYDLGIRLQVAQNFDSASKIVFLSNNAPSGSIESDEGAEILNFVGPWNLNGTPISVSGHTHSSSNITDFNNSVSRLLPVKSIVGSGYANIVSSTGLYIIGVTGLQPSGNYSLVGHSHISSDITNFNSSVSGLINGIYAPLNGKLNQFGNTSSNELASVITDETGSGFLVFNTSPSFSGVPTVPTAATGTNTNQAASTAFVRGEISNLVGSAPSTLDTLNELANALGNDANFSTTVTNNLASKANLSGAAFTGAISGPSGDFTVLRQNGTVVSVNGHSHSSSDITNFNSSVSGLVSGIYYLNTNPSGYTSNVGTVTSVAALTLGSAGTDVSSSVSNASTTPVIALNIPSSSASNRGLLTSTDWTTFNNKQPSGNYSVVGHSHSSSDITNFNSSVSGLVSGVYAPLNSPSFSGLVSASSGNITDLSLSIIRPINDSIQTVKNNTRDIDYFINLSTTNNTTQTQTFTIPNNFIWQYNLKLNVLNQTDNISAFFIIRGCIKNINNTITTVGSQLSETWTDDGMENITTSLTNNSGLRLEITGLSSKNLFWSGVLNIVQVGVS